MFTTPFAFMAAPAGGFDPDAQAYFDRVTAAGGSLTTTEKNATNTLVLDLKGYSIWTVIKAAYPMLGSSAASCAQNLKSASFTGTFSSGWTFASTGAKPDGSSAYMMTGFSPSSELVETSAHLSFYSRTQSTSLSGYDINSRDLIPENEFGLSQYYAGIPSKIFMSYWYPTWGILPNITNTLGFQIGTRVSTVLSKMMFNGSIIATNTTSITGSGHTLPATTMYLGATNLGDTYIVQYQNRECAFASMGTLLSDTQASDFYTAVQAFQTTLSRQV